MKTEEELIWESYTNNNWIIGYHGSTGNKGFDKDISQKGIWFVEDTNSSILDYYSTRNKQKTIIKCKILLSNNLDLTNYNNDTFLNLEEDDEYTDFMIDIGFSKEQISILYDILFVENNIGDYDDDGDFSVSISVLFNSLLVLDKTKYIQNNYDSVSILEGDDEETHLIFNKENIKIIEIIN